MGASAVSRRWFPIWKMSFFGLKFVCVAGFSDRRLADHFGGKLHLGYMQIREKLVDLRVSSRYKA